MPDVTIAFLDEAACEDIIFRLEWFELRFVVKELWRLDGAACWVELELLSGVGIEVVDLFLNECGCLLGLG